MVFCDLFLSFNIMFLRFSYVVACFFKFFFIFKVSSVAIIGLELITTRSRVTCSSRLSQPGAPYYLFLSSIKSLIVSYGHYIRDIKVLQNVYDLKEYLT